MARQVENVQALTLEETLAELETWEKSVAQSASVLEETHAKRDRGEAIDVIEVLGPAVAFRENPEDPVEWLADDLKQDRAYVAGLRARRDELES